MLDDANLSQATEPATLAIVKKLHRADDQPLKAHATFLSTYKN